MSLASPFVVPSAASPPRPLPPRPELGGLTRTTRTDSLNSSSHLRHTVALSPLNISRSKHFASHAAHSASWLTALRFTLGGSRTRTSHAALEQYSFPGDVAAGSSINTPGLFDAAHSGHVDTLTSSATGCSRGCGEPRSKALIRGAPSNGGWLKQNGHSGYARPVPFWETINSSKPHIAHVRPLCCLNTPPIGSS